MGISNFGASKAMVFVRHKEKRVTKELREIILSEISLWEPRKESLNNNSFFNQIPN